MNKYKKTVILYFFFKIINPAKLKGNKNIPKILELNEYQETIFDLKYSNISKEANPCW